MSLVVNAIGGAIARQRGRSWLPLVKLVYLTLGCRRLLFHFFALSLHHQVKLKKKLIYKYFMAANVFIQVFQKKSIEVVTIMIGLSCFRLCKSFCR